MQALAKYSFYVKCFQRHRMLAHHFLKTPMGVLLHSKKHAEAFNNVTSILSHLWDTSHISIVICNAKNMLLLTRLSLYVMQKLCYNMLQHSATLQTHLQSETGIKAGLSVFLISGIKKTGAHNSHHVPFWYLGPESPNEMHPNNLNTNRIL